jgi:hypothetical protein
VTPETPFPTVCACGCGKPPAGSFWATDVCLWAWLAKVNDPIRLPPEPRVPSLSGPTPLAVKAPPVPEDGGELWG